MNILSLQMTQGDAFYQEIGFVDPLNGNAPLDVSACAIIASFKLGFFDTTPLVSLTLDDGIQFLDATGVISLQFAASVVQDVEIVPVPRNGELVPYRIIYGDIQVTPPDGQVLVQGMGARTSLQLKIYLGIS